MHRIYCSEEFEVGSRLSLSQGESHHALKVLRLGEGDLVEIFNGKGRVAQGKVCAVSKQGCSVEVLSVARSTSPSRISLAFALPKGQALDFIFHRCTELGVRDFFPILTEHSPYSGTLNEERWKKVIIEVCKQCQSAFLPEIYAPVKLDVWIRSRNGSRPLWFCDELMRDEVSPSVETGSSIDLLVGSEGGWSKAEREQISAVGLPLSLGGNRLRAETAALVALTLAKKMVGEI